MVNEEIASVHDLNFQVECLYKISELNSCGDEQLT